MPDILKQQDYIEKFISELKNRYPEVNFGYSYDEDCKLFDIWHDSDTLQFENQNFLEQVGLLIKNILYDNEIYNISFGFDFLKQTKKTVKSYRYLKGEFLNEPIITMKHKSFIKTFEENINVSDSIAPEMMLSTTIHYSHLEFIPMFKNYAVKKENTNLNKWIFNNCVNLEKRSVA